MLLLYHVTTHAKVKRILRDGLQPKIGKNSRLCNEQSARIYLCEISDVPVWKLLTQSHSLIEVDMTKIDEEPTQYYYSGYSEYLCTKPIPPEALKYVPMRFSLKEANYELCMGFMRSICSLCEDVVSYYWHKEHGLPVPENQTMDTIAKDIACIEHISNSLRYDKVSDEDLRSYLVDTLSADGFITFCDEYRDSGILLYEKLIQYPDDSYTAARKCLYNIITTHFKNCLDATGCFWW